MKHLFFTLMTLLTMTSAVAGSMAPTSFDEVQPETTPAPVITFDRHEAEVGGGVEIVVTGEGTLTIMLTVTKNGSDMPEYTMEQPLVTQSPYSIFIPDDFNSIFVIEVSATAVKEGYLESDPVSEHYIMEGLRMAPTPELVEEVYSHAVIYRIYGYGFTAVVDVDQISVPGSEDLALIFPRTNQERTHEIMAYCEAPGYIRSYPAGGMMTIPARTEAYDFDHEGIYYRIACENKDYYIYYGQEEEAAVSRASWDGYGDDYSGQVVIPESTFWNGTNYRVTQIADMAFMGCYDVTSIEIPATVKLIGEDAFFQCESLTQLKLMGMTPPEFSSDINLIDYDRITLFVHQDALDAYRAHEVWGQFYRIVPFIGAGPGDVDGDGRIAIDDVTGLIDMLLGADEIPDWSDVNGDGLVNIDDITSLIDTLLGNK